MIPVFKRLDENRTYGQKELLIHINAMQEELFACLSQITSENITDISSDTTAIKSNRGSSFSGDKIELAGAKGEKFAVGYSADTGSFEFSLYDKNGNAVFWFDGEKLNVTE